MADYKRGHALVDHHRVCDGTVLSEKKKVRESVNGLRQCTELVITGHITEGCTKEIVSNTVLMEF